MTRVEFNDRTERLLSIQTELSIPAHPPFRQGDEQRSHPVDQQVEFSVGRCLRRATPTHAQVTHSWLPHF
ncbi:MAG: hypothetical protein ACYTX0_53345 [Nostoc sp.]